MDPRGRMVVHFVMMAYLLFFTAVTRFCYMANGGTAEYVFNCIFLAVDVVYLVAFFCDVIHQTIHVAAPEPVRIVLPPVRRRMRGMSLQKYLAAPH